MASLNNQLKTNLVHLRCIVVKCIKDSNVLVYVYFILLIFAVTKLSHVYGVVFTSDIGTNMGNLIYF